MVLGLLATALSWALFALTFGRFRRRPSLHNALYSLGLLFFALAVSAELLARLQGGWSPFLYRLWYLTGAMHGVTFLGLGSLALLRPRAARGLLLALSPLFLWGLYLVASAPLDFARLPEPYAPLGAAFPHLASPRPGSGPSPLTSSAPSSWPGWPSIPPSSSGAKTLCGPGARPSSSSPPWSSPPPAP